MAAKFIFLFSLLTTSFSVAQIECPNLKSKTIVSSTEIENLGYVTFSDKEYAVDSVIMLNLSMYDELGIRIGDRPIENFGGLQVSSLKKRSFFYRKYFYASSSEVFNLELISPCNDSKSVGKTIYYVNGVVGNKVN